MNSECLWICAESIGKRVQGDPNLVEKWRVSKGYRIKEIDEMIGLSRMRQEARNLERLFESGVRVPKLVKVDYENKVLTMEFLREFRSLKVLLKEWENDLD